MNSTMIVKEGHGSSFIKEKGQKKKDTNPNQREPCERGRGEGRRRREQRGHEGGSANREGGASVVEGPVEFFLTNK